MTSKADDTPDKAYARGYNAGKIKTAKDSLWRQAYIAALPFALTQSTWTLGNKPINTIEERVEFAVRIANRVVTVAKNKGKL